MSLNDYAAASQEYELAKSSANDRQIAGDHYAAAGIQHWDLVTDYNIAYLPGNASKYLTRWRKKNGLQDLEKSLHYIEKMIEKCQKGELTQVMQGSLWGAPQKVIDQFLVDNKIEEAEGRIISILCGHWTFDLLKDARIMVMALIAGVNAAKELGGKR